MPSTHPNRPLAKGLFILLTSLVASLGGLGGAAEACPLVGVVEHIARADLVTVKSSEGKRWRVQLAGISVPRTPNALAQEARRALGTIIFNREVAVHCVAGSAT
ncbi:MAG: hypothetical protein AAF493_16555, partial [Pseudomonadota bacterium]